MTEAIRN